MLLEFKEYATEVDVDFVRRSVRAIGRCAISLERAAERCINVLLELIQTKVNYVVQEAIIVIKDIFRRYPNRSAHELQSTLFAGCISGPLTNCLLSVHKTWSTCCKFSPQQLKRAVTNVYGIVKMCMHTSRAAQQIANLPSCCTHWQAAYSNPVFVVQV